MDVQYWHKGIPVAQGAVVAVRAGSGQPQLRRTLPAALALGRAQSARPGQRRVAGAGCGMRGVVCGAPFRDDGQLAGLVPIRAWALGADAGSDARPAARVPAVRATLAHKAFNQDARHHIAPMSNDCALPPGYFTAGWIAATTGRRGLVVFQMGGLIFRHSDSIFGFGASGPRAGPTGLHVVRVAIRLRPRAGRQPGKGRPRHSLIPLVKVFLAAYILNIRSR